MEHSLSYFILLIESAQCFKGLLGHTSIDFTINIQTKLSNVLQLHVEAKANMSMDVPTRVRNEDLLRVKQT